MTTLTNSVRIRRPDAIPLIVFTLVPAALFAAPSIPALLSLNVAAAFILLFLAYQFGYMLNCVADREEDAAGHKSEFADAVAALGLRNVVVQLVVTVVGGVVLGTYLLLRTHHLDLIAIGIVGTLLAMQYSLPPLNLKGRGVWQVPALIITMGFFPSLTMVRSFDAPIDWICLWGIVGSHIVFNGVAIVKTAEDYLEDGEHGVRTFVRAVGIRRSLVIATAMIVAGGAMILYMLMVLLGPSVFAVPLVVSIGAAAAATAALWVRTGGMSTERAVDAIRSVQPKFVVLHCTHLGVAIMVASVAVLMSRP